jgi:hypothetical protein
MSWNESNKTQFYEVSHQALMEFNMLNLSCNNCAGDCNINSHCDAINSCYNNLIHVLSNCVEQCCKTATSNINMKQYSFGWSDELKQQSIDIHTVWKQIGRPRTGCINQERLRVKALYKKCIHELKQQDAYRKREWLTYKLAASDSRGFWKGWKRLTKCNSANKESNISGVTDEGEICDGFKNVFCDSFCDSWSNGWATDKVTHIMSDIKQEFISNECSVFTRDEVASAIRLLKAGKSAGVDGLTSETIKLAHPIITDILQC